MKKTLALIVLFFFCFAVQSQTVYNSPGSVVTINNQTYTGDVEINAGTTVVFTGTIQIASGKKITVKNQARLIIDGATLTSSTNNTNTLWGGIIVESDRQENLPGQYLHLNTDNVLTSWFLSNYTLLDYGTCIIKNGATIKNALRAVTIGTPNTAFFLGLNSPNAGGFLYVDDAIFENNYGWSIATGSFNGAHLFSIWNSTFTATANTSVATGFSTHQHIIAASHKDNFNSIAYCTFSTFDRNVFSRGLYVFSPLDFQNCEFSNFETGIEAWGIGPYNQIQVNLCTFSNCTKGINSRGIYYTDVAQSTFTLSPISASWGIYLEGATNNFIQNNLFNRISFPLFRPSQVGIYANNTGLLPSAIRENTFSKIRQGCQFQQENFGSKLFCNTFDDVKDFDITVTSGRIANPQSMCSVSGLAANSFSQTCRLPTSDFNLNPGISNHIYLYQPVGRQRPSCASSNLFTGPCGSITPSCGDDPNSLVIEKISKVDSVNTLITNTAAINPQTDSTTQVIAFLKSEKEALLTYIVHQYIDSNQVEDAIDYIKHDSTFTGKFHLFNLYVLNNDSASAKNLIDSVANTSPTDPNYVGYYKYFNLMLPAYQNNLELSYLQSIEPNLDSIANDTTTFFSSKAKTVINYIRLFEDTLDILNPSWPAEQYPLVIEDIITDYDIDSYDDDSIATEDIFVYYPNPFTGSFTVQITNNGGLVETYEIKILDNMSSVVEQDFLTVTSLNTNSKMITLSNPYSGFYYALIYKGGTLVDWELLISN